jgi:hypothetical protein
VSQSPRAELYTLVAQALTANQPNNAASTVAVLAQHPDLSDTVKPAIAALQAILAGSHDFTMADALNLNFRDAIELRLLLEQLGPA